MCVRVSFISFYDHFHFCLSTITHTILRTILRIHVAITPNFRWNDRIHGNTVNFHVWIEDADNDHIYQSEMINITKRQLSEVHHVTFTIPVSEPLPAQYCVRYDD